MTEARSKDLNSMRDAGGGPPAGGTASDGDESNMQGRPTWSPQGSGPVSHSTSGPEATSSQGNLSSNEHFCPTCQRWHGLPYCAGATPKTDREMLQACMEAMHIAHQQRGSRTDWSMMIEDIRRHLESSAHETKALHRTGLEPISRLVGDIDWCLAQISPQHKVHAVLSGVATQLVALPSYSPKEPVARIVNNEAYAVHLTVNGAAVLLKPGETWGSPVETKCQHEAVDAYTGLCVTCDERVLPRKADI